MSAEYRERPSGIVGIEDEYTAFCFDEACGFILGKMREKGAKEPRWKDGAGGEGDLVEFLRGFGKEGCKWP
ncbi:MAG: hypothetical protein FWF44_02090 [Defluviitaleaceae bacterium]|nr:hypothetical protein [Defluviitaleaceae bacterium]